MEERRRGEEEERRRGREEKRRRTTGDEMHLFLSPYLANPIRSMGREPSSQSTVRPETPPLPLSPVTADSPIYAIVIADH
ncbi:hypothetical protein NHX12_023984 [Muraenolepis orangiensis]|uniref:Uncharacterized protein n=1 Tax=Muraenolepis orangiensis TaxID=630683 RepID=A0A9Q0ITB5_9TELE|nr:hypothetical protein NHX12_023984 [Muraenolepis orangiensis]